MGQSNLLNQSMLLNRLICQSENHPLTPPKADAIITTMFSLQLNSLAVDGKFSMNHALFAETKLLQKSKGLGV
jgi:hypothetical protein